MLTSYNLLTITGVIHAMRALNPEKIALFVVNNVPLVHQQGNVLQRELPAKLRVEKLTGGCLHAENDAVIKVGEQSISHIMLSRSSSNRMRMKSVEVLSNYKNAQLFFTLLESHGRVEEKCTP